MILDLNTYIVNKIPIQQWYFNRGHRIGNIGRAISEIAATNGCPCVATAFYIGEVIDWPQEVIDYIDSMRRFCGYDEIINVPDSYPGKR